MEDKIDKIIIENIRFLFPIELNEWRQTKKLFESRHIPDVCDECATLITDYVVDCYLNGNYEVIESDKIFGINKCLVTIPKHLCMDIENVFFNELECNVIFLKSLKDKGLRLLKNQDSAIGAYDHLVHDDELVKLSDSKKVFNKIKIESQIIDKNDEHNLRTTVYSSLIHEFNHAYEDYCRSKNGRVTYNQWYENSGYKMLRGMYRMYPYNGVSEMSFILYQLTRTEINAKVSEIYGILKGKTFSNSVEMCNAIKETEPYALLLGLYYYVDKLYEVKKDDIRELIQTNICIYRNYEKNISYEETLDRLKSECELVIKHVFNRVASALTKDM